ncbi:response regulator transcription factor [Leptothoe sp. PORK10 BA2]|uniref:response regulator transcription factor n=1 Tax=Leptothoe sp. PORK10 BA2 TaxID=3110254 RepID=UPI002B1F6DD2|nr:response regulator transcription factor [Leptothoe sp. PORK10 BA2]MEA5462403.1 response regulator transcription factor [Leptothoe sp. PORK10 BA2]
MNQSSQQNNSGLIAVMLVDDQQIIRQGLKTLLELEDDICIVGDADNGETALALLGQLQRTGQLPAVVLMDMRMPVMDGVAATGAIATQYPAIQVLVLTTFDDDELIAQAMAVGAKGYLLKDTPSEELAQAIRSVAKGYSQFGPGILEKMLSGQQQPAAEVPEGFDELTPREKEVLRLMGTGANNREIAEALFLSEGTVKNHVTRVLGRLGLRDRTQAALLAIKLSAKLSP